MPAIGGSRPSRRSSPKTDKETARCRTLFCTGLLVEDKLTEAKETPKTSNSLPKCMWILERGELRSKSKRLAKQAFYKPSELPGIDPASLYKGGFLGATYKKLRFDDLGDLWLSEPGADVLHRVLLGKSDKEIKNIQIVLAKNK